MGHPINKVCSRCNEFLPLSSFKPDQRFKYKVRPECRDCARPAKRADQARRWRTPQGKASRQAQFKRYCQSDRGKIARRQTATNTRARLRLEVLTHYSKGLPRCACCGEMLLVFLTIDHVNGGGRKHRAELKRGGIDFYRWLRTNGFPKGYKVLCFNCNHAKHVLGKCPHQTKRTKHVGPVRTARKSQFYCGGSIWK